MAVHTRSMGIGCDFVHFDGACGWGRLDVGPLHVHTAGVILSFSSSKAMVEDIRSSCSLDRSLFRRKRRENQELA